MIPVRIDNFSPASFPITLISCPTSAPDEISGRADGFMCFNFSGS